MFSNFKEEARKVLLDAKKEMQELKHPYVGSEHLLLAILKFNNNISERLKKYNLTYDIFKKELIKIVGVGSNESKWFLYTPLLNRILENAILDSKENNAGEVTINHLFSSMLEEGEGVAIRIMMGLDIDIDELYNEFVYKIEKKRRKNKKLFLEEVGIDLTKQAKESLLDPVIGREKEVERTLEILLRRTKNNPLLIGEAGVGKTAIVEELSRKIVNKEVPKQLQNKRIISVDMASLVAGTKYRGEFEDRIKKIIKELEENEDIILFIDEIHTLVGAGGAEGAIDASNIFKPYLARNKIRCIGATTIKEYKKYIEKDAALERRFQKVNVEIPTKENVEQILLKLKPIYENYHKVIVSDEIIHLIVELSNKYIYDRYEPDKSIDLLDEVCASVSLKENKKMKKYNSLKKELENIVKLKNEKISNSEYSEASNYKEKENEITSLINKIELKLSKENKKIVTKEILAEVIHNKTKIPVYEILNDKEKSIKNLEKKLKETILGQDEAIKQSIKIVKKIKLGFKDNLPYSMLFVGKSGVGKTNLSKLIGESLVGSDNIIKLDMSEYSTSESVNKILGAPPGYVGFDTNKNVLENLRDKPNSVLILDELEKASSKVIDLFLQILEDGVILDNNNNKICFNNVVIIMTSNVGYNDIKVGFNKMKNKSKLKDFFNTAFLNRIDNIIEFNDLTKEDIEQIVKLKLKKMKKKYNNIKISINNNVIEEIINLSNYNEFGARKIDKIIKNKIENIIIDNILSENYKITIDSIKETVN